MGEFGGCLSDGAEAEESGFAFDDGDEAGLAVAMDGIDFPVGGAGALFDDSGAFADHAFSIEATAAVGASVAFAAAVAAVAKVKVEGASALLVCLNPAVDCLVAHDRDAFEFGASYDLLRAKV